MYLGLGSVAVGCFGLNLAPQPATEQPPPVHHIHTSHVVIGVFGQPVVEYVDTSYAGNSIVGETSQANMLELPEDEMYWLRNHPPSWA